MQSKNKVSFKIIFIFFILYVRTEMSVEAKTFTNKSNGETFTKGTYNGIEVLRRDKDGSVSYTHLTLPTTERV